MSSLNQIIFYLIVIHCSSCRQQNRDTKEDEFSDHARKNLTKVSSDATIIESNALDKPPTLTEVVAAKEQIGKTESVPSNKGGIVVSKRLMSFGNKYLWDIEKGFYKHTVPELSQKDLVGVDLVAIRAGARPLKSPNAEIKISDPATAYARVLDLGISMVATTQCVGIFENEDTYFIFYGSDGEPISRFSNVFSVNKNNGKIAMR